MSKPILIDLFGGVGGAAKGYQRAGFHVISVDIAPQPDSCADEFVQADLYPPGSNGPLKVPTRLIDLARAWHASPPCQGYGNTFRIMRGNHPLLIPQTREFLQGAGSPWVIENVPGAPLIGPVELCGCMFDGLGVYRPRLFETSFRLGQPVHEEHRQSVAKMGRPPLPGQRMHVVGNYSGAQQGRDAMGIHWTRNRKSIAEAIPPAYTEHIGRAMIGKL